MTENHTLAETADQQEDVPVVEDRMPGEALNPELVEFAHNPEPRCACVLLLDSSGSMQGGPIAALNEGVVTFRRALEEDSLASLRVETAVVSFDSTPRLVQDFATVDALDVRPLQAGGATSTGKAIEKALEMVESRKQSYKEAGVSYYRPWVILITDGAPTDSRAVMDEAIRKVHDAEERKQLAFFCVGVEGADIEELRRIAPSRTAQLSGLKFEEFFEWLSSSMTRVSASRVGDEVSLPDMSGWAKL